MLKESSWLFIRYHLELFHYSIQFRHFDVSLRLMSLWKIYQIWFNSSYSIYNSSTMTWPCWTHYSHGWITK